MDKPVFQIIPALLPAELHKASWEACTRSEWAFGNQSNATKSLPFWKMELADFPAIDAAWEHARPRCEDIVGKPLRVLRQYANGHTYGQGGRLHHDDRRPDTYTLLYFPMPDWLVEWEGETVFYDGNDKIATAVLPAANRAIFFDSRIGHAGRPPSRFFGGLRVIVAFKLETVP